MREAANPGTYINPKQRPAGNAVITGPRLAPALSMDITSQAIKKGLMSCHAAYKTPKSTHTS